MRFERDNMLMSCGRNRLGNWAIDSAVYAFGCDLSVTLEFGKRTGFTLRIRTLRFGSVQVSSSIRFQ
jgi:hypothetical protein